MIATTKKRALAVDSSTLFTASFNREDDWRRCCATVMGFEWVEKFEDDNENSPPVDPHARIQQVINLMDDDYVSSVPDSSSSPDSTKKEPADPWTENALRIQSDLHRMAKWIQSKQYDYVGLNMPNDEASLIQSTVATFCATTASELETLRKLIGSESPGAAGEGATTTSLMAAHRSGIVQILLSELQEQITQPFSILQKQRTRISVQLWQHPWQCQLALPNGSSSTSTSSNTNSRMLQLFDDDKDDGEENATREKRFMPRTPLPPPEVDFLEAYGTPELAETPPPRPEFLDRLAATRKQQQQQQQQQQTKAQDMAPSPSSFKSKSHKQSPIPPTPKIVPGTPNSSSAMPFQEQQQIEQEDLQREAAQLQVTIVQSDLDSVQKMEQRMVEITTLIGQFSNLVSEQQEDILDIAHHAQETKQNMDKGQENLVDATERTKRSKHYLAWTIFGLSMTLLFFHTLRN